MSHQREQCLRIDQHFSIFFEQFSSIRKFRLTIVQLSPLPLYRKVAEKTAFTRAMEDYMKKTIGLSFSFILFWGILPFGRISAAEENNAGSNGTYSTVVLYPSADNLLAYTSYWDSPKNCWQNFAYPNGEIAVGTSFWIYPYSSMFWMFEILIKFELPAELINTTIKQAKLQFSIIENALHPQGVIYKYAALASNWVPNSTNFNNSRNMLVHTNSIGYSLASTSNTMSIDVTTIVQNWSNGNFNNYGLWFLDEYSLCPSQTTVRTTRIYSSDYYNTPSQRPQLIVNYEPTAVVDIPADPVPDMPSLRQNYPNPFNSETQIQYYLPKAAPIAVEIFDLLGHKIRTLVDEQKEAGFHTVLWNGLDDNGSGVTSGFYWYRMQSENFITCRKLLLVK